MDIDKIWEEGEWPSQARQITNGLKNFPKDSKIILILRHSQRDEPQNFEGLLKLRLTEEGHAIARKLGEELPKDRPVRLFHSIVWRCQETAQDILSGFENVGGKGKMKGIFTPLFNLETSRDFFPNQLKKYSEYEFFYRWVAGLYPSNYITSLPKFSQKAGDFIWREYKKAPDRNIDIHITHDFFVIALKFGWFGIPPDNNWISYLGGFAVTFIEDKFLLLDSDKLISIESPYWWGKS
ncbi:MAG: histidine phosphatase family protein [Candidatus Hodarchaeota archaeon]